MESLANDARRGSAVNGLSCTEIERRMGNAGASSPPQEKKTHRKKTHTKKQTNFPETKIMIFCNRKVNIVWML